MRVDKDYVGALRSNLERLLRDSGIQFRNSAGAGRVRYDIDSSPPVSLLIADFGVVASQDSRTLDLYVEWLGKKERTSLLQSTSWRKVATGSGRSNSLLSVYLDSNLGDRSPSPVVQAWLNYTTALPKWSLRTNVSVNKGLLAELFSSFSEDTPHTKRLLAALQKPLSNRSVKFLPGNTIFFATTSFHAVWEMVKDELIQGGIQEKQKEVLRLLDTFHGEMLLAVVPDEQGQLGWFDSYVLGFQQKAPSSFVKALDETLPEIKGFRQSARYQNREITCYPGAFGVAPCFIESDGFVFLSLSRDRLERIIDVHDGKIGVFQAALKSDEHLKRILSGENHGLLYANLKEIAKMGDWLTEVGETAQFKRKLMGTSKPFYLAGVTKLSGEVFKTEAFLAVDLSDLEEPVLEFANGIIVRVALMQRGGTAAPTGPMVVVSKPTGKPEDPWIRGLAEHLARTNGKLYCAYWAPHCQEQKEMFGSSGSRLPYVECSPSGPRGPQAPECQVVGIKAYPTWIVNGRRYGGTQTLENLASYSGFKE